MGWKCINWAAKKRSLSAQCRREMLNGNYVIDNRSWNYVKKNDAVTQPDGLAKLSHSEPCDVNGGDGRTKCGERKTDGDELIQRCACAGDAFSFLRPNERSARAARQPAHQEAEMRPFIFCPRFRTPVVYFRCGWKCNCSSFEPNYHCCGIAILLALKFALGLSNNSRIWLSFSLSLCRTWHNAAIVCAKFRLAIQFCIHINDEKRQNKSSANRLNNWMDKRRRDARLQ